MTAQSSPQTFVRRWWWVIAGLVVACAVVLVLAPAASSDPDGLDRVSQDQEFAHKGEGSRYEWLPDYSIPGVENDRVSVVLAGLVGVGAVFGLTLGFGALLRQSRRSSGT